MPIHEIGYRSWSGPTRSPWLRWWCISRTGIALALRTKLTRRLSLFALVPVFWVVPMFFAIGLATDPEQEQISQGWLSLVRWLINDETLLRELRDDPSRLRGPIWNDVFLLLQSWSQLITAMVITVAVAPALISRDLRSKAYLIYFSKPITKLDYLLGKVGVIGGYLAWFTLVPSLLIYVLSIVFAPNADALSQTISVVPSIVSAALITILPITAVSLLLSSSTKDERIATFAWVAVCFGGHIAESTLSNVPGFEGDAWVALLSPFQAIRAAIGAVFDPPVVGMGVAEHGGLALGWLALVTTASTWVVWRRISAPMRI